MCCRRVSRGGRGQQALGAARLELELTIHRHNKRNRLPTKRLKHILIESTREGTPDDTNKAEGADFAQSEGEANPFRLTREERLDHLADEEGDENCVTKLRRASARRPRSDLTATHLLDDLLVDLAVPSAARGDRLAKRPRSAHEHVEQGGREESTEEVAEHDLHWEAFKMKNEEGEKRRDGPRW